MSARLAITVLALVLGCNRTPPGDTETDTDTDADTDSDTDSDADVDCADPESSFLGTLDSAGVTDTKPYTTDAGIAALIAADPGDGQTVTVDLQIDHAVVAAVEYQPSGDASIWQVWISDVNGNARTFAADTPITVALAQGDIVSFHATELNNYHNELEITKLDGFVKESGTSPVWLVDIGSDDLDYSASGPQLVRGSLHVTSDSTSCSSSGSTVCYDAVIKQNGQPASLRVLATKGVVNDDCIEFVAPIGIFDDGIQFNIADLDWVDFL